MAKDGNWSITRWNAAKDTLADQWLEVEFDKMTTFSKVITKQHEDRISKFKIQYEKNGKWLDAYTGESLGTGIKTITFGAVTAKKMRLYVVEIKGKNPASIYELAVYR